MADQRIQRMIETLSAEFDASVARAEDDAANDLARSLAQDRTLDDVVADRRHFVVHLDGGVRLPVQVVGSDYVLTADPDWLVALDSVTLEAQPVGADCEQVAGGRLGVLRRWAHMAADVEVVTRTGTVQGTLVAATPDHVEVRSSARAVLVAHGATLAIRRLSGGSTGES